LFSREAILFRLTEYPLYPYRIASQFCVPRDCVRKGSYINAAANPVSLSNRDLMAVCSKQSNGYSDRFGAIDC
jgi:hypothetical protein